MEDTVDFEIGVDGAGVDFSKDGREVRRMASAQDLGTMGAAHHSDKVSYLARHKPLSTLPGRSDAGKETTIRKTCKAKVYYSKKSGWKSRRDVRIDQGGIYWEENTGLNPFNKPKRMRVDKTCDSGFENITKRIAGKNTDFQVTNVNLMTNSD